MKKKYFKKYNKQKEGFTPTLTFTKQPCCAPLAHCESKCRGFTLVETLVAISIFTMSILAVLVVLTQGIANDSYAKKKITASYLAQEGIEYIRNMRDTFVLYDPIDRQTGWNAFNSKIAGEIFPSGNIICAQSNGDGCWFGDLASGDFTNPSQPMIGITVEACTGPCRPLLYDEATGKYGYASGVDSGFIRKVTVNQISADQVEVSSTVSWTQNSGNYSITFSENLFNWIE